MNRVAVTLLGIVLVAVVVLAAFSIFIVRQTEQALVLQFGEVRRNVQDPGLHFKVPYQTVLRFDKRVLDFDPPQEEVIAADQKRLVVDSYARFRIADPLQFYQSVGNEAVARTRLASIVSSSLRRILGSVTLSTVLSDERADIMRQIRNEVDQQARPFGIDVVDVRIRRADLPDENSQAIYERMKSEREREAREFRAQGAEFAQRIRSAAERERTVILAEAQRQAQILRGQGESDSVRIYAEAFGRDQEFFAFYRSMQAYREALGDNTTTMVLSPDSEFFRFFGTLGASERRP